ncbi:hypothetical protein KEJ34_05630, partial [Candidatus Bathyarchaeota archaeon]|nr:hypothetical protein [Candidatus Bathyarchaeota archaeon]
DSNLNVVMIDCAHSGRHIIIGRGAGGKETASSVMRDIISIIDDACWRRDCDRIFLRGHSSGAFHKCFYRTETLTLWGFI